MAFVFDLGKLFLWLTTRAPDGSTCEAVRMLLCSPRHCSLVPCQ